MFIFAFLRSNSCLNRLVVVAASLHAQKKKPHPRLPSVIFTHSVHVTAATHPEIVRNAAICTSVATSDNKDASLTIHIAHFCVAFFFFPPFSFATQEFSRAEQVAFRVRKSDERAVGQQWQAAAGGAPEEVSGGQLQAERIAAGGTLIQMHKVFV